MVSCVAVRKIYMYMHLSISIYIYVYIHAHTYMAEDHILVGADGTVAAAIFLPST